MAGTSPAMTLRGSTQAVHKAPAFATSRVMPALGAGIHVLKLARLKDVDGRDKPGHDVERQHSGGGHDGVESQPQWNHAPQKQ
jgi:hypothetical protein